MIHSIIHFNTAAMINSTAKETILIIEDDAKLAQLISSYLSNHDYRVYHAENGRLGLEMQVKFQPQLIILDLMMPELDGLSVCRQLQNSYKGLTLVLTASDDDMDHVAALEIGADDFVHKPIHPRVLLARIRNLLRRASQPVEIANTSKNTKKTDLCFGSLEISPGCRSVKLNNAPVTLTEAEFELLYLLASNPELPLSRDDIYQSLRGIEYDGLDRSIDNRIVSLRRKLEDNKGLPKRIITVRGKGYLFVPEQW